MDANELQEEIYALDEAYGKRFSGAQPLAERIPDLEKAMRRASEDLFFEPASNNTFHVASFLHRQKYLVTNARGRNKQEVILAYEQDSSESIISQLNSSYLTNEPAITTNLPAFRRGFIITEMAPFTEPLSTGYAIISGTNDGGRWRFKKATAGLVIIHSTPIFPVNTP